MKKTFATACIAAILSTGLMSTPAYADKFVLSIGDGHHGRHDRHDRWDNGRHHGWRQHSHWDNRRHHFHHRPIVVSNSYFSYYTSPQPVQMAWNSYDSSRYCREYNGPARVGGRIVQTYGNACLMPDGSWQIVD